MQSRLAVLMVADLVGYSALMEKDEASTVQAVRSLKETHLEPPVIAHGGEVLKRMGDGWIIAFTSITSLKFRISSLVIPSLNCGLAHIWEKLLRMIRIFTEQG